MKKEAKFPYKQFICKSINSQNKAAEFEHTKPEPVGNGCAKIVTLCAWHTRSLNGCKMDSIQHFTFYKKLILVYGHFYTVEIVVKF